jgi:hypothetical protein
MAFQAPPLVITAWSDGHYIGSTTVNPSAPDWQGGQRLTITLNSYYTTDNSLYSGFSFEGVSGSASCGVCHREYKEWQVDAHSQAAINPRFISMYTGSDVNGNPGQLTELDQAGLPCRSIPMNRTMDRVSNWITRVAPATAPLATHRWHPPHPTIRTVAGLVVIPVSQSTARGA